MKVVFDDEALDDLQRVLNRISKENPRAADNLAARIFDKVERLATPELAEMGRPGLDAGTRELIEYPYIIVYEVHFDRAEIVVLLQLCMVLDLVSLGKIEANGVNHRWGQGMHGRSAALLKDAQTA
jgi:toxin ParE1/3/4